MAIQFLNTVQVDTSVLYVDTANNRVGIGTTSPNSRLEVNGEIDVNGGDGYRIEDRPWANWGSNLLTLGDWDGEGYATRIMGSNSSEVMRVTGNNVGIGTDSPGAKLEVNGTIDVNDSGDRVFVADGSDGSFSLGDLDGLANEAQIVGDASTIKINNLGSTTLTSTFNNRIGIGTTSPAYKLDVSGDAYIDETLNIETTISGTLANGYGGVGAGHLVVGGNNFASFTPAVITLMNQDTSISAGQDLGVLQFGGKDDQTNGYANGQIRCTTAGNAGTGNSGGGIFRFLLSDSANGSAPTERMRITNTGNVGVGTTSPSQKLHVAGNARLTGLFYDGTNSGGTNGQILSSDGGQTEWIDGSAIPGVPAGSGTINYLARWTPDANTLGVGVTYDNGTNVGIGTSSPSYKLDVNGDGRFGGTTTSANTGLTVRARSGDLGDIRIRFDAAGTLQRSYISDYYTGEASNIGFERNNSTGTGIITFDTSNSSFSPSERMRIDSSGNVGIGTTSPSEKLDVNGVIRGEQYLRLADTGGTNRFSIRAESTYGTIDNGSNTLNYNANNHLFLVGLSEKMRIDSSGNVGIGTTAPSAKLEVNGSTRIVGSLQLYQGSTSNQYLNISQSFSATFINTGTSGETIFIGAPSAYQSNLQLQGDFIVRGGSSSTSIQTQSSTSVVTNKIVDSGISYFNAGNVGIGTTSPSEKLEVDGHIKAVDGYKGYLPAFQHGGFYHSSSSSSNTIYWIPTNYFNEVTSSQYYNNWVAPYDGRVKKIVMRWASGTTPTATSVTFRYQVNSTTSTSTFPATVANGASTNMTATKAFGDTDITFNAGDRVLLGFTTDGGTRLLYGFAYTIVLEYNKD